MPQQVACGGHDNGDAGLVVGAEQGRAAGGDDILTDRPAQERGGFNGEHLRGIVGQHDGFAVVFAVDDRLGGAGEIGRGVAMAEPRDHRDGFLDRRGNRAEHVAVLVDRHLLGADPAEFAFEEPEEVPLSGRAGSGAGGVFAARVNLHVAQEAFEEVGGVDLHADNFAPAAAVAQHRSAEERARNF